MVSDRTMDTAIADSGATSSCGKDNVSECSRYQIKDPLISIGQPSNIFQYAGGNIGTEKELKRLSYDVRGAASEIHSVPGIKKPRDTLRSQ